MKKTLLLTIYALAACSCSASPSAGDGNQARNVLGLPLISTPTEGIIFSLGFGAEHYEIGDGKGTIDDVAAGAESGYRIVAIDGAKARRLAHPLITYIPLVAVSPGRHVVTLEKTLWAEERIGPNRFSFTFEFEAGKSYRLKRSGNLVFIIDSSIDS